jgi:hypothetical protein
MMPGSREISLQGDLGELGDIAKYRLPLFDQWVLIGSSDKGPQDVMPYETKARSGSCSGCSGKNPVPALHDALVLVARQRGDARVPLPWGDTCILFMRKPALIIIDHVDCVVRTARRGPGQLCAHR